MGYYGYIIYMLPALVISLVAQLLVKTRYSKYSKVASRRGITAHEAARAVLRAGGVHDVAIGRVAGSLTDHYNPQTNSISLSDSVHDSTSVAAIGIAAHEAGHALQYANGYVPIKLRASMVPVVRLGSFLGPLLIIAGFFISMTATAVSPEMGETVYLIGIILFSAVALFQLVTLPVEFNASRRAMQALKDGNILERDELSGARKVLTAAALTYVAALLSAVMEIFYYASRFRPKDR